MRNMMTVTIIKIKKIPIKNKRKYKKQIKGKRFAIKKNNMMK